MLAQLNALKALLTDNKEHAVATSYDGAGNPVFSAVAGQPGQAGIDITSVTGTLSSFTHTHYTGLLSIFSGSDLRAMYGLYTGNHMANPRTFNMTVITASGTVYSLAISDPAAFAAFGNNTLQDDSTFGTFEYLYGSLYRISTANSVSQNELAFLQMITQANTGLTLYKGDLNNFASWQKLTYSNNTAIASPCN